MTFQGLLSRFHNTSMWMIFKFITVLVFWICKGFIISTIWICSEYESATVNGLKLNQQKNQSILIHRCKADIPPPTLLIGANTAKVGFKMKNLGFVLNEN
jgi:hypothetical protein